MIKDSIKEAMGSQGPSPDSPQDNLAMTKDIQDLKRGHKELAVEKRISTLKTEGAQSQYRTVAFIGLKLEAAAEKLDELSLTLDDPQDPFYIALASIKEDITKAQDLGNERLDLISKADSEPSVGWKALTKYEQALQNSEVKNPEREKLFSECVKKVTEEKKKKAKVTAPQFATSMRPFQFGPGLASGYTSYPGRVLLGSCFIFLPSLLCLT